MGLAPNGELIYEAGELSDLDQQGGGGTKKTVFKTVRQLVWLIVVLSTKLLNGSVKTVRR